MVLSAGCLFGGNRGRRAGGAGGGGERPCSLARMLSEILHGCLVCRSGPAIGLFPSSSRSAESQRGISIDYSSFWVHVCRCDRVSDRADGRTTPRLIYLYTPRRSFVRTLFASRPSFELARPMRAAKNSSWRDAREPPKLRADAGFLLHLANPAGRRHRQKSEFTVQGSEISCDAHSLLATKRFMFAPPSRWLPLARGPVGRRATARRHAASPTV